MSVVYIVENNISFYDAISLENDESNQELQENKKEEAPMCQISNEPLEDNFIRLRCGHVFNYDPLFFDLVSHKRKANQNEINRLNSKSLRCPYCRAIQQELLPPDISKPLVFGVNFYCEDLDFTVTMKTLRPIPMCSFVCKEPCKCTYGKQMVGSKFVGENETFYCRNHLAKYVRTTLFAMHANFDKFIKTRTLNVKKSTINHLQCVEILKSGKRKGNPCGKLAGKNGLFCGVHFKNKL
jgi:hypothetical protein